jgi:release factor glutamine methyltransferase
MSRRTLSSARCREFEPDEALFAGKDGLDAYPELAPQLPRLLNRAARRGEIGHDQARR